MISALAGAIGRAVAKETGQRRADLSESADLLVALMDSPLLWRERLVEELTFESGAYVRVVSSYQVAFPPSMLEPVVETSGYEAANLLLPLTTREKRQLINLRIAGPGGSPARLLPRDSIAALESVYLMRLIDTTPSGPEVQQQLRRCFPARLLEAICVFTPDYYLSLLDECDGDETEALTRYLQSGLGKSVGVKRSHVHAWRQKTHAAGILIAAESAWLPQGVSSAEEMLLALPRVDPLPKTVGEISDLVFGFCRGIAAAAGANPRDALLLRALGEYGRRYELIVEVELPLLEPSVLKVVEDRPLGLKRRGWLSQPFRLGDARSAHLEARVGDPNVEIEQKFDVQDLEQKRVALGRLESVRQTEEALALYSAEDERPDFAELSLRLRPRRHLRWTSLALTLLNLAATAVALTCPRDESFVERLAVLTVPTTLAATFVLVREQTALASKLQATARGLIAATMAGLWGAVFWLLLTFHPPSQPTFDKYPAVGPARKQAVPSDRRRHAMARNGARGNGRVGAVRGRTQTRNAATGRWTKRNTSTGRFMDVKKSGGTFKGVRRER